MYCGLVRFVLQVWICALYVGMYKRYGLWVYETSHCERRTKREPAMVDEMRDLKLGFCSECDSVSTFQKPRQAVNQEET